jgi:hypothetical protein
MFQIIMCNMDDVITSIFEYTLQDGNPSVNEVRTNLNSILLNKFVVQYDRIRNNLYIKEPYQLQRRILNVFEKYKLRRPFWIYKSDRDKLILLPYLVIYIQIALLIFQVMKL